MAQIEKGEVNPTISVLWKIANGYKVSFTSLVERTDDSVSIIRLADVQPLQEDEGRYLNYPIFPFDEQKLFETYRIVIEAGGMPARAASSEGGCGIYHRLCRRCDNYRRGRSDTAFKGGFAPLQRRCPPRVSKHRSGVSGAEYVDLLLQGIRNTR